MNLVLVFLSAALIILADSLIKKAALGGSFTGAFLSPWMIVAYVAYFLQILLAILIFVNKGELAVYTNLFIVFYSLFGVLVGVLFFKETLSVFQLIGVLFAIAAAVFLNIR
jgi:drug/metabolite transporter (DMT)-like permease